MAAGWPVKAGMEVTAEAFEYAKFDLEREIEKQLSHQLGVALVEQLARDPGPVRVIFRKRGWPDHARGVVVYDWRVWRVLEEGEEVAK